jgi:hypothetical protein
MPNNYLNLEGFIIALIITVCMLNEQNSNLLHRESNSIKKLIESKGQNDKLVFRTSEMED